MFLKFLLFGIFITLNAFANVSTFCGLVTGTAEQNKIKIHFDLDEDCIFYTSGKQDLSTPPLVTVDNENIEIGNIIWPKGKIKTEMIGDEKYEHTIADHVFYVDIPYKVKKHSKNSNFNINLSYQLCKNTQCKAENIILKMEDGKLSFAQENIDAIADQVPKKCTKHCIFMALFQIIIAFLSGIILNFMPCVLPILGIKLSSLSYGNKTQEEVKFNAFMSLLGIISSFVILGLMASIIKLPFEHIGDTGAWGSMFQNRYFIVVLTIIVAIFIDVQRGSVVINANFNNKFTGGAYNFFSGILSTILATPCVAPVIGLSLVFSSNSSFIVGVLIFMAIGLGFGLPYIIVMFYPDAYKKLPKTGKFSVWLTKFLSFLMFLTFFWLIYIIVKQSGLHAGLIVMVGIFIFSRFGWKMKSNIAKLILFIAVITPMFLITNIAYEDKDKEDKIWQKFSNEELDKSLLQGKIVLVLGTADWCSWCHILEKTVLERTKFLDFITKNEIMMLKFDASTKDDKEVRDFYNTQQEYGVPILKIYSDTNPNGRSLIIHSFTADSVIKEIKKEIDSTHEISIK